MTVPVSRRSLLIGSSAVLAAGVLARAAADTAAPARLIANENPYGPAESARRAVSDALATGWQYPMGEEQPLKKLIAAREGLTPEHVMIGEGSGEILRIAGLVYGAGGSGVVAATPTFGFLQDYARQLGGVITEVPLDAAMRHDLPALAAAVTDRTRLLYVCNPNNPDRHADSGLRAAPLPAAVASRTTVLVDEAYLDLWDDWPRHTATERVAAGDPVIVTRTFSKLHGMAGLAWATRWRRRN